MIIEAQNFPSDSNALLGNLRKELINALHKSSQSDYAFSLLSKTLKKASELMDELVKEKKAQQVAAEKRAKEVTKETDKMQKEIDKRNREKENASNVS